MPYLTPQALEGLRRHKYSCCDVNLLSKYVFQPLWWSRLLRAMPLWVAPNVITLCGLAAIGLAAIVGLYHFPYMVWTQGSVQWWVFIVMGLGVFAYQSLDAIDGQQARRTGSGSTLGELLDHSIDAVATCLAILMVTATMSTGGWTALFAILFASLTFWVITWEEYLSGTLTIWYVSGAVDGPFLAALMLAAPGFNENVYRWSSSLTFNMPLGDFILQMVIPVSAIASMITNTLSGRKALPGKHNHTFSEAMAKCLGPVSMALLFAAIAYNDPWVMHVFITEYLVIVLASFVHLSWHLLLAHITETDYDPFTVVFIPLGITFLNSIFKIIPLHPMIYCHMLFVFASLAHMAISVVRELSRALDVPIFTIKHRPAPVS